MILLIQICHNIKILAFMWTPLDANHLPQTPLKDENKVESRKWSTNIHFGAFKDMNKQNANDSSVLSSKWV